MRSLAAAALVATAACSESPTEVQFQVIEQTTFAASLGIDLTQMTRLASGVYIQDLAVGSGQTIAAGNTIRIDHTGWLSDGTVFSQGIFTTQHRANPAVLIPGFDEALAGMTVGGTRKMVIPPEQAYGARGNGPIPPGAIVVFETELLAIL